MKQTESLPRLVLRCSRSVGKYMAVGGLAGVLVTVGCYTLGNSETQRFAQEYPQVAPIAGAVAGGICNVLLRHEISNAYRKISKPLNDLKWDFKFWWAARRDGYN